MKLKGYSNEYLQQYLIVLYEENFFVVGNEDILEMCPCCRYLTLTNRGDYDICPLYYWEDDGKSYDELDSYSSVSHTTFWNIQKKFEKKSELNKIPYRLAII